MKQLFVIVACALFVVNASAQTVWKDKVVGHWKYAGVEEFGVVNPADSTEAKDELVINADGTFTGIEKGKAMSGTYKIDEAAKTMTMKFGSGSRMFYLKKSDPGVLIIESQTPDLVRTRHRFTAAK